ncbi:Do/DeqQ family serine protease [Gemmobacter caeni]|uniref:Do/DeqQ family serine protease n=1 Tax=Gemmobacter caeni TaxID=589035 RepID=A0A2T6B4I3_9RHOB|nr:trypsin-like peptidase domain-containing protein [Gemmobacter caeni]PTX50981.1 Do/DeqQ family serine protease [Gemmobacter caeni]TWJ00981.1 Do/DeqQ family serine protease [Gemmobacter caeni]
MPRLPVALAACLMLLPVTAPADTVPGSQAEITMSFAPVVKAATPAVVNIYATVVVQRRETPFAGDPFFEQFFQDFGRVTPRVQNSLGSGVIVSPEGIVVSNYHVVGQATEIRVELSDRREYRAHVLLADEQADLAVLQLEGAADLPSLLLRNSDDLEVGDLVLAIGNPFGVGQTVSSGIVSGLGRSSLAVGGGRSYFVQTDAAINPGNSGGALVDMKGQLVGINTAIVTKGGGSNGIGFAIPANLVRNFIDQAKAGETRFKRPWAGVTGQAMDSAMAEALGLPRPEGVVLSALHPDSPFRAAGLEVGDIILSVDGEATDTPQGVMFRLAALGVGREITVDYLHRGEARQARVALVAPPDSPPREAVTLGESSVLQGLEVARINPAVLDELELSDSPTDGVIVTNAEGLAARTGLRPGDVLRTINGEAVKVPGDVMRLTAPGPRRWGIEVQRGGQQLLLRFRI